MKDRPPPPSPQSNSIGQSRLEHPRDEEANAHEDIVIDEHISRQVQNSRRDTDLTEDSAGENRSGDIPVVGMVNDVATVSEHQQQRQEVVPSNEPSNGISNQHHQDFVVLNTAMAAPVKPTTPDKEHYESTFPPRLVLTLSGTDLLVALTSIVTQIVLMAESDRTRSSLSSINAAPGVWAGLAAAIAGCVGFMAAKRPTGCTVPSCLATSMLSALLGMALVGLATYGLVLVKQDGEADPEGPHLIRISMHPAFNRFMIKPLVDDEKVDEIRALIRLQLACFSIQLLSGIAQVVSSVLLSVLCCRAWRWRLPHVHGSSTAVLPSLALTPLSSPSAPDAPATAASTVLFATRPTECRQREGFVSIPVPAGLYSVTGDTLERQRQQSETLGARQRTEGMEQRGGGGGDSQQSNQQHQEEIEEDADDDQSQVDRDPPPKYEPFM